MHLEMNMETGLRDKICVDIGDFLICIENGETVQVVGKEHSLFVSYILKDKEGNAFKISSRTFLLRNFKIADGGINVHIQV